MLLTTLARLRCPACVDGNPICGGKLSLFETTKKKSRDILFGTLLCDECASTFPILAGVAVLVNDVDRYLQFHVKGVSALIEDQDIPQLYREGFLEAKAQIEIGATEEDLESQRINALYFMNHYLRARKTKPWWKPSSGPASAEIDRLIRNFWDHGPFAKIAEWTKPAKAQSIIELGCGVGGLAQVLSKKNNAYLGVDSAFASIALARHIYLRAPYSLPIQIPQDLYEGPLTGKVKTPKPSHAGEVDFVVGELENFPVVREEFDLAIALNAIDMIEDPPQLPQLQHDLVKPGGIAIQSCPYIWHKNVTANLRKLLPKKIRSSSAAVEHLYSEAGLKIFKKIDHLPWLFLKHFRQIELYSVHLFAARKIK